VAARSISSSPSAVVMWREIFKLISFSSIPYLSRETRRAKHD
jgi:hypothetical protein